MSWFRRLFGLDDSGFNSTLPFGQCQAWLGIYHYGMAVCCGKRTNLRFENQWRCEEHCLVLSRKGEQK